MKTSTFLKLWLSVAALLPVLAFSQDKKEDADQPRTVIHAGHMLDVKTGVMIDNATVVIQGDKILSIGPMTIRSLPAGTKEINLPNATLLPGLIDAHTHITFDPNF